MKQLSTFYLIIVTYMLVTFHVHTRSLKRNKVKKDIKDINFKGYIIVFKKANGVFEQNGCISKDANLALATMKISHEKGNYEKIQCPDNSIALKIEGQKSNVNQLEIHHFHKNNINYICVANLKLIDYFINEMHGIMAKEVLESFKHQYLLFKRKIKNNEAYEIGSKNKDYLIFDQAYSNNVNGIEKNFKYVLAFILDKIGSPEELLANLTLDISKNMKEYVKNNDLKDSTSLNKKKI